MSRFQQGDPLLSAACKLPVPIQSGLCPFRGGTGDAVAPCHGVDAQRWKDQASTAVERRLALRRA
jgi:hypothetical protein